MGSNKKIGAVLKSFWEVVTDAEFQFYIVCVIAMTSLMCIVSVPFCLKNGDTVLELVGMIMIFFGFNIWVVAEILAAFKVG